MKYRDIDLTGHQFEGHQEHGLKGMWNERNMELFKGYEI